MLTRQKKTLIADTLPPVAELLEGKRTFQWYVDLSGKQLKFDFVDLVHHDPWRIPMPVDREGYNTQEASHFYWSSGHTDWLNVNSAIEEFGIQSPRPLRILDVGCASGRFLRHVAAFGKDLFDIWGSDLAPANIEWIKRYLPNSIKAITNTATPHLPFADNFFDVVTAFSLLPHLDELEDAWFLELGRITKANGLMYLTFANQGTWQDIVNRPSSIEHFERTNSIPGNDPMSIETFQNPMYQPRIVRRTSKDMLFNCYAWHHDNYVQQNWSRYANVHRIVSFAHLRHQAVLLASPLV